MKFSFRFTAQEYAQSLRLNNIAVPLRWKHFVFVIVCLIPSLLIFWWIDAALSLIWFGVMTLVMAGYALHAFFSKQGFPLSPDQEFEFSENDFRNTFSHSITQVKWGLVESFDETKDSFRIGRLSRIWLLPKRALGNQIDECRELFERAKNRPLDETPIPLYREVFDADSPFEMYQFKYLPGDLQLAVRSPFVAATMQSKVASTKLGNRWGWLLISIGLGFLIYLGMDGIERNRLEPIFLGTVLASWVLPVGLMLAFRKLLRKFYNSADTKIPLETNELRLSEKGWAVGDRHGVVLYDWRDVSGIFHNQDFFGFKTVSQLLNIIPLRAFPDKSVANRFLAQAMDLHQRAQSRDDVPMATVIETGNPYQAPMR